MASNVLIALLCLFARISPAFGWVGAGGNDRHPNVFKPPSKSPKDSPPWGPRPSLPWYSGPSGPTPAPTEPRPTVTPTRYAQRWNNFGPGRPPRTNQPTRGSLPVTTASPSSRNPTHPPTSIPSARPTPRPTTRRRPPTSQPTLAITARPSLAPTQRPTRIVSSPSLTRPSPQPVVNPTISTTPSPSQYTPTIQLPDDSSTPEPSMAPLPLDGTPRPSVLPPPPSTTSTVAPTNGADERGSERCVSQGNLYGSLDGDPRFVEYGYEIETNPNSIVGSLASDVLPILEQAFNDYLLPDLFPQKCPDVVVNDILTSQRRRQLRVVGLSATPNDEPRPEFVCRGTAVAPQNECVFVRGSLILFVDENELATVLERRVRDRLKLGMDNDIFMPSHPSIQRLTYVETDAGGLPTLPLEPSTLPDLQGNTEDNESPNGPFNNDLVFPMIMASAAVLIVVAGALVARRFS